MTSLTVLTPARYRRMPWRNGGGRTTEIAAYPEGADFARFQWRVSVADVERSGPFSQFPGVDRFLVLLAGDGMRLRDRDATVELRAPFEPVKLAGDVAIDCELIGGPVRDFNLMVRRDTTRGTLAVVRGAPATVPPARFIVCFAAAGACECLVPDHPPIHLRENETMVRDGAPEGPPLHVNPVDRAAAALVAAIDTR